MRDRLAEIKAKGFDVSRGAIQTETRPISNTPVLDFGNIKVGAKTLEDAVFQLGDLKKANSRLADPDLRTANYKLGHERPRFDSDTRGGSWYARDQRARAGNKAKINAIKAQFDAGDISRKEMEKQIAALTPSDNT